MSESAAVDSAATRQHAATASQGPQVPEPGHAERVRTLFATRSQGTLATVSARVAGYPFGSLMPYGLDAQGRPVFLISNMAMHTQNMKKDGRASLFVEQASADGDPLGAARATLVGDVAPVDPVDVRVLYLGAHPNSRYWVDFADFGFWRLQPVELYYVGGFGVMGWVSAEEYAAAEVDPLASSAAGIVAHMNADHVDSMIVLARQFAGMQATEAAMTSADRLGFTLRLKTSDGMKGTRINFTREVRNAQEARAVLVEMVKGRAKANYLWV